MRHALIDIDRTVKHKTGATSDDMCASHVRGLMRNLQIPLEQVVLLPDVYLRTINRLGPKTIAYIRRKEIELYPTFICDYGA